MNISLDDKKIEKYLDELADEYKILLFKSLISHSKSLDALSVSELLRLDSEIKRPLFENYQRQQKRRRRFLLVGLIYMFLGFSSFVMYGIVDSGLLYRTNNMTLLISIVFGFIGLFIVIISFAFPTLHSKARERINNGNNESLALLEYEVITKWRELEGIVNDISINANVKTSRSIIEFLSENQFIDKEEYFSLKEFLKMRNDVVHSSENLYEASEIKEMISKIDKIISKIKKII